MPSRSATARRSRATSAKVTSKAKKAAKPKVAKPKVVKSKVAKSKAVKSKTVKSALPVWDLSALYSSIDAPEIARDLDKLDAEAIEFENRYKGRLAEGAEKDGGGNWLATV